MNNGLWKPRGGPASAGAVSSLLLHLRVGPLMSSPKLGAPEPHPLQAHPGGPAVVPEPYPVRFAYLSLPRRCNNSTPAIASSNRSSAAATAPASPAGDPGPSSLAAEPSPRGTPDSRKVADRIPRATPATEGRAQSSLGGARLSRGGERAGRPVTVLSDVCQERTGQPPRAAHLGPGLRQHHLDLCVGLRARGLAESGRARYFRHRNLQPLVLRLGKEKGWPGNLALRTGGRSVDPSMI